MHTDSSANRTWRLSRSASLKTATVEISSSRQARMTRSAISPRFAMSTLRNMEPGSAPGYGRPRHFDADGLFGRRQRGLEGARVDRAPQAIRGRGDPLELELQLVRVVAVPQRLFLVDRAVAHERQHR